MAQPTRTINIWEKIQQGVNETERLIGQKNYNKAMIQARQTLEIMVKSLGDKACIVEGDLASTIDQLYENRWIDKSTKEHYHKIRMIGNKAVHEGNNSAADANLAYHLLSQEVYAFSDYRPDRRRAQRPSQSSGGGRSTSGRNSSSQPRTGTARSTASRSGGNRRKKKQAITPRDLLPVIAIIAGIILLVVLIRVFRPGASDTETTAPTSNAVTEMPSSEAVTEPETAPTEPETTAAAVQYVTTDTLNVRSEPSTDARILVQLAPGTPVNYVGVHDDFWSIINYDGTDAYVATQYLTESTP